MFEEPNSSSSAYVTAERKKRGGALKIKFGIPFFFVTPPPPPHFPSFSKWGGGGWRGSAARKMKCPNPTGYVRCFFFKNRRVDVYLNFPKNMFLCPNQLTAGFRNQGKFLLVESGILENLACGIQNPRHWNPEYSSKNLESHGSLELRIQFSVTKSGIPALGIQNPRRGFQDP